MNTETLRQLISRARADLAWPVREEPRPFGVYSVSSDSRNQEHGIFMSSNDAAWTPGKALAFLHELGHALLCERVHPVFATYFPVSGIDDADFAEVAPALNAASDWFVGHWLMEFCPDVATDDLRQEYEATVEALGKEQTPTPEDFYVAALVVAQAIRYLDEPVDCGGILGEAVAAFLAVPPGEPSAHGVLFLANRLLAFSTQWRCRLADEGGEGVLGFYLQPREGELPI